MAKRITLIFLMLLIVAGAESAVEVSLAEQLKYDIVEVTLIAQQGRFKIRTEVADSNMKISQGLMHRSYLAPDAGMLFVFRKERVRSFWMKNTLIPLDIIFVSKDLRIMHIAKNTAPCKHLPCAHYSSVYPIKYVLEINGGLSQTMGLKPGDYVELGLLRLTDD